MIALSTSSSIKTYESWKREESNLRYLIVSWLPGASWSGSATFIGKLRIHISYPFSVRRDYAISAPHDLPSGSNRKQETVTKEEEPRHGKHHSQRVDYLPHPDIRRRIRPDPRVQVVKRQLVVYGGQPGRQDQCHHVEGNSGSVDGVGQQPPHYIPSSIRDSHLQDIKRADRADGQTDEVGRGSWARQTPVLRQELLVCLVLYIDLEGLPGSEPSQDPVDEQAEHVEPIL